MNHYPTLVIKHFMSKAKPIYSLETLFKIVYDLKGQGKRIGITHGAFDLFHYSHLDLLEKSAYICDYLIVGIDSDVSVKNYKSYKRPIIPEDQRMKIINSVWCVNTVFMKDIPHDSFSHIKLYKNLMVDIVTIGCKFDKKAGEKIENDAYRAGSRLIKIDTWQEPRTSSIVNDIIKKYTEDTTKIVPKETE